MIAGVDLGTSFSSIAYQHPEGIPTLVGDAKGDLSFRTSSVVGWDDERCCVGSDVEGLILDVPNAFVVWESKLQLGARQPIVLDRLQRPWMAESIQALILAKLRNDFVASGNGVLERVVLAVPATFGDQPRRAFRAAAELIDLPVEALVEAPIAAARFLGDVIDRPQHFLVCDFGGGQFETSVIRSTRSELSILGAESDRALGAREIEEKLARMLAEAIQKGDREVEIDQRFQHLLRLIAQKGIVGLTQSQSSTLRIDTLPTGFPTELILSRNHLSGWMEPLLGRAAAISNRCLQTVGLASTDIDRVFLIGGGSCQSQQVAQRMAIELGIAREKVSARYPSEAVAYGAAMLASEWNRDGAPKIALRTVCPCDLGIRIQDPRSGKTAIYKLIKQNAPLPAHATKIFKTSRQDQERMVIEVVQVSPISGSAVSLGHFHFSPIHPQSAHHPIEVSIDCDAEGMVQIGAKDALSGQSIRHKVTAMAEEDASQPARADQRTLVEWGLRSL